GEGRGVELRAIDAGIIDLIADRIGADSPRIKLSRRSFNPCTAIKGEGDKLNWRKMPGENAFLDEMARIEREIDTLKGLRRNRAGVPGKDRIGELPGDDLGRGRDAGRGAGGGVLERNRAGRAGAGRGRDDPWLSHGSVVT